MSKKYKNTKHKNPFREDRPKKPFPWLTAVFAVLLITAVVLCAILVYERFGSGVRKFKSDFPGETVYDTRNCITYEYMAMTGYQAAKLKGIFATCGDYTFYEIEGIDTDIMLYSSFKDVDGEVPYGIFCVEDYVFPKLSELVITSASINETEINTVTVGVLEKEAASEAMNLFLNHESVPYPSGIVSDSVWEVYFFSENYSYLSYTLKFFFTESGERYLSDSTTGRHVKLEAGELEEYFPSESE